MVDLQKNRVKKSFEAEHRGLFSFIRSKINSLEEAEDLLQDIYVQALGNLNVLEAVDNLTGWFYTVAKNKIIDWYRKKRLPIVSLDHAMENGFNLDEFIVDEIGEMDDDESEELLFQAIKEAIDALPEKQRYVFIQQVVEDKTFRELAEETGEPLNTLIARKRYAIQFLQTKLTEIKKLIIES
jgi:RNA polymerase sigma factor (sigma-70 family)